MNLKQFKYSISNFLKGIIFFLIFSTLLLGILLLFNHFSKTHLPFGNIFIEHPYLYIPGIVLIISIPFIIRFLLRQHARFRHLLKKIDDLKYEIKKTQQGIFTIDFNSACRLEITEGHPIVLHIHNLKMNDIKLIKKVNYSVKYRLLGIQDNTNWYVIFQEIYQIIPKNYSPDEFDIVILIFKYLGKMFDRFQSINHQVEITMDNFLIHASPIEIKSYFQKIEQMIEHLEGIKRLTDHPPVTL